MESFSNWETIVTQIEKQTESQSSFNKDSGCVKNKEQNFQAHFHDIDVAYDVSYQMSAKESSLL